MNVLYYLIISLLYLRFKLMRIRRLLVIVIIILILLSTVYNTLFNNNNNLNIVAAMIISIVSIIEGITILWDRLIPLKQSNTEKRYESGSIERYLNGRLKEFEREQNLFVRLAGQARIKTRYTITDNQEQFIENIEEALELFNQRFVLIGDPGAGKSTTLRFLFTQYAQWYLDGISKIQPFWINLGLSDNPKDAEDLLNFWWNRYGIQGDPIIHIRNNNVLLFLDGLNEMPETNGNRRERALSLKKFFAEHTSIAAIITSRIRDYETELELDLPLVTIQSLDEKRIREFIAKRLGNLDLWYQMQDKDALIRLSTNPYNLVMLTELYKITQKVPSDLTQLYADYIRITYEEYTQTRKNKNLTSLLSMSRPAITRNLGRLGYRMIANGKGTAANVAWVQWQIGRASLKNGIDIGVLLVESGAVRFYHQSLHAYFALPALEKALRPKWYDQRLTPYRRISFIRQIADLQEAAVPTIPLLISILIDTDDAIRTEAIRALGLVGRNVINEVIAVLLNALVDKSSIVRNEARDALKSIIKEPDAIPFLINGLADNRKNIRVYCSKTLIGMGSQALPALPIFIEAIKQPHSRARHIIALIISSMGVAAHSAAPALTYALRTEGDEQTKFKLLLALQSLKVSASPAIPEIINLIYDKRANWELKLEAVKTLESIGLPAIQPLIELLAKGDQKLLQHVVQAIASNGSNASPAVPRLIELLSSSNLILKIEIVKTLRSIGPKASTAVPELLTLIRHTNTKLQIEIINTIIAMRISDETFSIILVDLLYSTSNIDGSKYTNAAMESNKSEADLSYLRKSIILALGQIGANNPQIVRDLISSLYDNNYQIRKTAREALIKIYRNSNQNSSIILSELFEALSINHTTLRVEILQVLGSISGLDIIQPIVEVMMDKAPRVRATAAEALGNIGNMDAIPYLLEVLKDETVVAASSGHRVRDVAAEALRKLKYRY